MNQTEKQQQQSKYGSQASGSAQETKRQTAEEEKRARLRHVAKQWKRAMETGADPPLGVVSGPYYWRTEPVWTDKPAAQSGGVSIGQVG